MSQATDLLYVTNARIPTEKAHGFQIIKTIEALQEQGTKVQLVVPYRSNPIEQSAAEFNSYPDCRRHSRLAGQHRHAH